MSINAFTEDQLVEQPAIDMTVLAARGWTLFNLLPSCESDFRDQLLTVATRLGVPTVTRTGGNLCDTLLPTQSEAAKPNSLSKIHSVGEFPLHTDTAHWPTPCHYVMLACVSPGCASRPTMLLDTRQLNLNQRQTSLLQTTPLRIVNGRNSFFSTILSNSRPFVRFDPGCMTANTADGVEALIVFSRHNWPNYIQQVHWEPGYVLIIDNWRLLHGRGHATCLDLDRKLLRISIR
ncbi:MAG TPA: TauD/TfdA family dioxygenase [Verrucomicrobiae bacterium]|jgi:alpha-ketoglutarate-dependent taurine dioxygenase